MSGVIVIRDLCRKGKLNGVTLSVGAGEVVTVVGSRGAGKTTLVSLLAGQLAPDSGSAVVQGVAPGDPRYPALVGVAGEAWGLYERLTVRENLQFFAVAFGVPGERVAEVLQRLELAGLASRPVAKLTDGEQARLRLARALLHDPPALLLDEPAGDIDRESTSILAFVIGDEAERGKAILLTTFGHRYALEAATRLCYLEDGGLVEPAAAAARAPVGPAAQPADPEPPRTQKPMRHVAARKGERLLLFRPEEIRLAYAQEKAVYIQTAEGPCLVTLTLSDLEERLQEEGFFRCHRAYLVNLAWVKELAAWTRDSYSLILKDGKDVPLSKHRAQELRARLSL